MQKITTMAKKFKELQESIEYVRSLPLDAVIKIAAESLVETESVQVPRITITEEQFQTFFKLRGINDAGEKETRGRKRKEV